MGCENLLYGNSELIKGNIKVVQKENPTVILQGVQAYK